MASFQHPIDARHADAERLGDATRASCRRVVGLLAEVDGITSEAPALRDLMAEQGPGPREAWLQTPRWNPTPATSTRSELELQERRLG